MKETKVYMNNLPETCDECPCHSVMEDRCVLLHKQAIEPFLQSCPLKCLKTHDQELVKEVCEKIRENIEARNINELDIINRLAVFLDEIEKEFEK